MYLNIASISDFVKMILHFRITFINKSNLFIWLMGLFCLPLLVCPSCSIEFEIPKVWLVNRWVEVMVLLPFIRVAPLPESRLFRRNLLMAFAFWIGIMLLSAAGGEDVIKSVVGNFYRGDGIFTMMHLVALTFWLAFYWEKRWEKPTAVVWGSSNLLVVGLALWEGWQINIQGKEMVTDWPGLVASTFGQPNFLAGYLVVTLSVIWHLWKSQRYWIWILGFIGQLMAIVLTGSRGGVMGIGIWLCVELFIWKRKLGWFLIICLAIGFWLGFKAEFGEQSFYQPESRARIWSILWASVESRPLLGWGWANTDYAFSASQSILKFPQDVYVDKSHSHWLEMLVTTGILGLISYLFLQGMVSWYLWREMRRENFNGWYATMFSCWFLFVIHSQLNIISIAEEIIFWIAISLVLVERRET